MTVAAAADDDGGNSFVSFLLQIFGPIPPHFRSRKSSFSSVRIEEEVVDVYRIERRGTPPSHIYPKPIPRG